MIPLLGFMPDADPTTPGILVDCENVVPTDNGVAGAPAQADAVVGLAALAGPCRGSAVLMSTSGSRRHFAGTQTSLFELTTAWIDVSRTANYVGSSESRWLFEQFGNVALATNNTEKIQWSVTGDFDDITAAPIARVVFATDNFVFALDYNHTTLGDVPDGWWCSAYQDYSSWTASVTTQATTGRLIGDGGPLTAGLRLGPYAVAYKATSLFLGTYVGSPIVWQWERIPGQIGCVGPEALCDIGGAHVFVGEDNIWLFDGTRPQPIAEGQIRQWFFDNSNASLRYRSIFKYDRQNNRVWLFYVSASGSSLDSALVYHLKTQKWGRANQNIEAAVNFVTPGITWDTLSTLGATWDALPDIPWDSQLWQAGGRSLAVFNTSHTLQILGGASTGGGITTGDFGDDERVSMLRTSRVRFKRAPTSATAVASFKFAEGDSLVVGGSSTAFSDGKFDHRQSARFHRIAYTMVGPFEAMGVQPELVPEGQR
jgi:hypothetical protein